MTTLRSLVSRPSGEFAVTDRAGKVLREGQTLTCVHCGGMWEVQPGSGRSRSWCFRCNGPTCGSRECSRTCLPWERQMEIRERRVRLLARVEEVYRR